MNRKSATLLVSSAGRRVQLIDCFRDSARSLGVTLHVVAADLRPGGSAASQLADVAVEVPRCTKPEFIPAMLEICRREGVTLVVPTIDTELEVLSAHREAFAAIGATVAISTPAVVAIAADKARTAAELAKAGVPTPRTASLADYAARPSILPWPVIVKPRRGSSSIGVVRPSSPEAVASIDQTNFNSIAQELVSGREYTVNVFFDRTGVLRCAVPHLRIETRGGEVSKGRTEDVPPLRTAARQIAACLPGPRGALCFQAIVRDDGSFAVFEINARFGGGYPLAHRAGAPFARWLLEEALGLPCTAHDNWRPGVTMLRYDSAVFLNG